ncbi:MAG TPA: C13 family peptidase, partial [Rhodanobacteraceae bacterium]|nr:C13 family peptidase [Rhodanobacteraceae bacterium]
ENVFRNEAEYAEKLFAQRFGAEGRVLVLENNAATVATRPLATLTNLEWALDDVAKTMDPAEDILLLYVTTHGSHDHELLVDLEPLPLDQIGPDDLADALKSNPAVRWKVLIVNACYSGGFIDALRDDSTLVMTSARADRTSFGCGAASDITYFGKAFLAEALNRTTSIPEAFALAKQSVTTWEDADKEEHSEPQIASTRSIEAKLESWRRTLAPGDPLPFAPAQASR